MPRTEKKKVAMTEYECLYAFRGVVEDIFTNKNTAMNDEEKEIMTNCRKSILIPTYALLAGTTFVAWKFGKFSIFSTAAWSYIFYHGYYSLFTNHFSVRAYAKVQKMKGPGYKKACETICPHGHCTKLLYEGDRRRGIVLLDLYQGCYNADLITDMPGAVVPLPRNPHHTAH